MYEDIIHLSYTQARDKHPVESISSNKKIINFKNNATLSTYLQDSDVMVMYDIIKDLPLVMIERCKKSNVNMFRLAKILKQLNKDLVEYTCFMRTSKNKEYVDIVVIRENVYKNLKYSGG